MNEKKTRLMNYYCAAYISLLSDRDRNFRDIDGAIASRFLSQIEDEAGSIALSMDQGFQQMLVDCDLHELTDLDHHSRTQS